MKKRPLRIKDIAGMLNISVATVSRALRGTYDVNEETRKRVLELAGRLNYRPNFHAAALASGNTRNIVVATPFITNYYFSTVISGIQEAAYENGYNVILLLTNDDAEREQRIINDLPLSSLDGILVSISSQSVMPDHFQELIDAGIPVVFFDRAPMGIHATKVVQDDFRGAFLGTEHLIANGYRKIAHIAGPEHLAFTQHRLQGYLAALEKYDIPIRDEWIIFTGFSPKDGENDTRQLFGLKHKPDAVFCVNDRKGVGAIIALKDHGIRVGREVGVVGFTNDPISTIIEPALTTVEEPAAEIGRMSCELLLQHIRNRHFLPKEIVLPCRLIVRNSSRRD